VRKYVDKNNDRGCNAAGKFSRFRKGFNVFKCGPYTLQSFIAYKNSAGFDKQLFGAKL
jgi:hypothetical protein